MRLLIAIECVKSLLSILRLSDTPKISVSMLFSRLTSKTRVSCLAISLKLSSNRKEIKTRLKMLDPQMKLPNLSEDGCSDGKRNHGFCPTFKKANEELFWSAGRLRLAKKTSTFSVLQAVKVKKSRRSIQLCKTP